MSKDVIPGEILPDGTLKLYTENISDANHISAEKIIRSVTALLGGPVTRTANHGHSHGEHHHEHAEHDHVHE